MSLSGPLTANSKNPRARRSVRVRRGAVHPRVVESRGLRADQGRRHRTRITKLAFEPAPACRSEAVNRWNARIAQTENSDSVGSNWEKWPQRIAAHLFPTHATLRTPHHSHS